MKNYVSQLKQKLRLKMFFIFIISHCNWISNYKMGTMESKKRGVDPDNN